MKPVITLIIAASFLAGAGRGLAQQPGKLDSLFARGDTTAVLDSLMRGFDAFVDSLSKPKSFFSVSAGIGNRTFSVKNNSFNAQESATSHLSVTPAVAYFHKSGLGLSLTGFLASVNKRVEFYQYAITPSYDYIGEKVLAGISYTKYFGKDSTITNSSPYENDFYGYFNFRQKNWRFGLSGGYATGSFYDKLRYHDSAYLYDPVRAVFEWVRYVAVTKSYNKIEEYSLSALVRRQFRWYDVLRKDDNLTFSVTGWLQAGAYNLHSQTNVRLFAQKINLSKFRRSFESSGGEPFRLQSAALSCSMFYSIHKFNIQPVWFLDYYIPSADKQFSQVFSLVVGLNF